MTSRYRGSGIAVEPVRLFTRYLFDVWPFRKVYFEMPEFNYRQFASASGGALRVEARLRDHDYYRGRRWDRLTLAAYRSGEGPSDSDADCGNGFLHAETSHA
jgi:RimJ/RimL family protein N-acetyltransferase